MDGATCPSCSATVELSPIAPTLFEAAAREEYQCQACRRWSRREKAPHFIRLILEFRTPLSVAIAGAILTFRLFGAWAAHHHLSQYEVWSPPVVLLLGTAFSVRGIRKRLKARRLVPIEPLPPR